MPIESGKEIPIEQLFAEAQLRIQMLDSYLSSLRALDDDGTLLSSQRENAVQLLEKSAGELLAARYWISGIVRRLGSSTNVSYLELINKLFDSREQIDEFGKKVGFDFDEYVDRKTQDADRTKFVSSTPRTNKENSSDPEDEEGWKQLIDFVKRKISVLKTQASSAVQFALKDRAQDLKNTQQEIIKDVLGGIEQISKNIPFTPTHARRIEELREILNSQELKDIQELIEQLLGDSSSQARRSAPNGSERNSEAETVMQYVSEILQALPKLRADLNSIQKRISKNFDVTLASDRAELRRIYDEFSSLERGGTNSFDSLVGVRLNRLTTFLQRVPITFPIPDENAVKDVVAKSVELKRLFSEAYYTEIWEKVIPVAEPSVVELEKGLTESLPASGDYSLNLAHYKKFKNALIDLDRAINRITESDTRKAEVLKRYKPRYDAELAKRTKAVLDVWKLQIKTICPEFNELNPTSFAYLVASIQKLNLEKQDKAWVEKTLELLRNKKAVAVEQAKNSWDGAEKFLSQLSVLAEADKIIGSLEVRVVGMQPVEVVDPNNIWASFAYKMKFLNPGENPGTPENVRRIEQGILNYIISYATTELWANPNDHKKIGEAAFEDFPIRKGAESLKLNDVLNKHPIDGEGPGTSKEFREVVALLRQLLEAGPSWGKITEKSTHEMIIDHLNKYALDGYEWHQLMSLPPLEVAEAGKEENPGFGEQIAEGLYWYSNWNKIFIYLNPTEKKAISDQVEEELRSGIIKIPLESTLIQNTKLLEKRKQALPSFDLGSGKDSFDSKFIMSLYIIDANQDYSKFRSLLLNEIKKLRQRNLESSYQVAHGIHPLREIGEGLREAGAGESKNSVLAERREIAIAIGCYKLGWGDYLPNLLKNKPEHQAAAGTVTKDKRVAKLSRAQLDQAFEAGKSAEMFAFSTYEANGVPMWDDAVTAKSANIGGRLARTELYRKNYMDIGREGLNRDSVSMIVSLVPHPWHYMAADGIKLTDLFGDRSKRKKASFENLGKKESGAIRAWIEIYEFAVDMYSALCQGFSAAKKTSSVNLLKMGEVKKVSKSFAGTEEYLEFNDPMIRSLVDFIEKTIGYYIDRLNVSADKIKARGSIYDPSIWHVLEGTSQASPLVPEKASHSSSVMLRLPTESWTALSEEIKRIGFKKAIRKMYFTLMIVESLMRGYNTEILLEDVETLKFIFAGQPPKAYSLSRSGDVKASLEVADVAGTFAYKPSEIAGIIEKAKLNMKSPLMVFMASQSAGA